VSPEGIHVVFGRHPSIDEELRANLHADMGHREGIEVAPVPNDERYVFE
jgi:hypothetical protein